MFRSVDEVETLRRTIGIVDQEIARRRSDINRNLVANVGLASRHVELLERQNNYRKKLLNYHRGNIEALYKRQGELTNLRDTFFYEEKVARKTPKGDKVSWFDQFKSDDRKSLDQPVTKDQAKRQNGPLEPVKEFIEVEKEYEVALPPSMSWLKGASDRTRVNNQINAAKRAEAVKDVFEARRDAELIMTGKKNMVDTKNATKSRQKRMEQEASKSKARNRTVDNIVQNAINSTSRVNSKIQRQATNRVGKSFASKLGGVPKHMKGPRPVHKGSGIVTQTALLLAMRSPSSANRSAIADQFTEDIRQSTPGPVVTHSAEYYDLLNEFLSMLQSGKQTALKALGVNGEVGACFTNSEREFWINKTLSNYARYEKVVRDTLLQWDSGQLQSGINISTDNRSQSTRKSSAQEVRQLIYKKTDVFMQPAMADLMTAVERACSMRQNSTVLSHNIGSRPRNINIPVSRQVSLGSVDKTRGNGRPVLTPNQRTPGLAGLFPALRSSMQGVLRR
tara:strand:+ start:2548 stop:4068 length:1521 start_codon:yes stop_codon:yes gene_type:complete